jgi:hypothetical protein
VPEICFVAVPTIAAGSLPMVSAFIIRSGSFDAAQGLLSAYTFLYQESEGEDILSAICFC